MMTELIIALLAHMPENRIVQGGLGSPVFLFSLPVIKDLHLYLSSPHLLVVVF